MSTPDTPSETQAIRRTLLRMAERISSNWGIEIPDVLMNYGLDDKLIAWVLDDPSPDSPADKPCETCGGSGLIRVYELDCYNVDGRCPSCRGGEPT